ncbi:MAG: leucine-rich repeat domain-containing protein [Coriobacteriales bacterium]|jgi:hypothetical protein
MSLDEHRAGQGIVTRRRFVAASGAAVGLGITAASGLAGAASALAAGSSAASDAQTFTEGGLNYTVLADDDGASSGASADADGKAGAASSGADAGTPRVSVGSGATVRGGQTGDGAQDATITSVEIPQSVTHDGVTYRVTQVAAYAFQSYPLESVTLPEGLERIGKCAFQFCRSLRQVELPASLLRIGTLAFFACGSLASVTFAEGSAVTEIADGAFAILKTSASLDNDDPTASLASIELPASLSKLGSYAFYGQTQLASVTFGGDTLEEVSPYAFGECTSLARIDLPTLTSTVERIGRYAFENDAALAEVTFSGGVSGTQTTQAGNEFSGCTGIKTVIYHEKKWNSNNAGMNPSTTRGDSSTVFGGNFSFGTSAFSDSPDVTEYYTVRRYASADDATAGVEPTAVAVVAAGTPLHELCAASCELLDEGARDWVGASLAFEEGASVAGNIADSLACWDCDPSDLSHAGIEVNADVDDNDLPTLTTSDVAGGADGVDATVWSAAGTELSRDTDYELAFDGGDPTAAGTYTLVATGTGSYSGQTSAQVSVVDAAATWQRLSADDWDGASKSAAEASFENASLAQTPCEWAVVAAGGRDHLADDLSAAALAGALGGVLVLTDPDELSQGASYEINRVGATTVVVVGDTDAVSQDVEDALQDMYVVDKVYRIAGTGKAGQGTDMRVVSLASSLKASWGDTCLVASASDPAPAVVAASWAYAQAAPIVWAGGLNATSSDGDSAGADAAGLTSDVAAALSKAGLSNAILLGGEDLVSSGAQSALEGAGLSVERVEQGSDPSLCAAVARRALELGAAADGAVVVDATGHPDLSACAAELAGHAGAVTLDAADAAQVLQGRADEMTTGYVLGSSSVVGDDVLADLEGLA